jgi:hypothetical protein
MLKLEDLRPGMSLVGLEPAVVATLATIVPIAEGTVQVIYRTPDGSLKERLLGRGDESAIASAAGRAASPTTSAPWGTS